MGAGECRTKRVKGVVYTVTEGGQTLGGERTMGYTDVTLQSCTPEIYIMLSTNADLMNMIQKYDLNNTDLKN